MSEFTHIWAWGQGDPITRRAGIFDRERKGEPCRIVAHGSMNSRLVEFEDGYRVVTSGSGLRRRSHPSSSGQRPNAEPEEGSE